MVLLVGLNKGFSQLKWKTKHLIPYLCHYVEMKLLRGECFQIGMHGLWLLGVFLQLCMLITNGAFDLFVYPQGDPATNHL